MRLGGRKTWAVLAMFVVGIAAAYHLARGRAVAAMVAADPEQVLADPRLTKVALTMGRAVFAQHCATCHGAKASGIPDLRDHDWLYGVGRVAEIEAIVRHGIRAGDRKGWNLAAMPAYATPRPYAAEPIPPLTPQGSRDVSQYLLSLAGRSHDLPAAARGKTLYAGSGGCWDCHGVDARGDSAVGAPNLADAIWLYGDGSAPDIRRSIDHGRAGVSPAFAHILDPAQLRAVAVYVASLSQPRPSDHTP